MNEPAPIASKGAILVVDDNPANLKLLAVILTGEGYAVRLADSGELALASAAENPPELILLDIRLPDVNGLDVCRRLKERAECRDIPVLFISAVMEMDEKVEGFNLGAVDFIAKPVHREELLARVRTHLELSRSRAQLERQADDLRRANEAFQREIVERQRTGAALKESEERFRRIFEEGPLGMVTVGSDFRFLRVNAAFCRMLGYSEDELCALTFKDITHPDCIAGDVESVKKVLRGEIPCYRTVKRYVRKEGTVMWGAVTVTAIHDDCGRFLHFLSAIEDVSERKRAEEALRESEARHRVLFEGAAEGIAVADAATNRIRFANPAYCALYGYTEEELPGLGIEALHPRESLSRVMAEFRAEARGEKVLSADLPCLRKDGSVFFADISTRPVVIDGRPMVVGFFTDVTARKREEEQLLAVNELQELLLLPGSIEQKLKSVTDAVVRTLGADFARIWTIKPGDRCATGCTHAAVVEGPHACRFRDGCLHLTASSGRYTHLDGRDHGRVPFGCYKIGMIAAGDQMKFLTNEAASDPRIHNHAWVRELGLVSFAGYRLTDSNGMPLGVLALFSRHPILPEEDALLEGIANTTSQVIQTSRAEEKVVQAAHEWQTTFDATNDVIWILDKDQRVLRTNKTAERFFQRSVDEMVGRHCWEIVHGTAEPHPECPFARAQRSRCRETMEIEVAGRFLEITVDPIIAADGQHVGAVHIVSDITARRQAEEQVREQAALLDTANDAIYVRALDHTVTYWNEGAERLYGWTRAEALGRKITELGDVDRGAFEAAHAALLEQGSWIGELKKVNKAGGNIVVFCRWTLLRDEEGRPREILAINTDVTEKKHLEANLLRAQRLESIGALAGGIAHDLNNILAPILMTASLLRETAGDAESREMLRTVETCAERGGNIIRQLLTFARGRPGARVPLPVPYLLDEMEKIVRETFPRNIRVVVQAPQDLWSPLGDATQIHQALMNLCVNARDAMAEGGTLTLAAANMILDETFAATMPDAKPGPCICVSVADTGVGIPPENLERIFDPFFTTKEIGKGTGLGLPTVMGILRGHGGFVRVDSKVGFGTTVELYLPASPAAYAVHTAGRATPPPRGGGELILVVDDEAIVRGVLWRLLEKHGYRVLCAADGAEALALFEKRRGEIRAVLTDMMMPGMDGAALVRALSGMDTRLPVLGMTGLGERMGIRGLDDLDLPVLLIKPFAGADLLDALHKALTARRAAEERSASAPGAAQT